MPARYTFRVVLSVCFAAAGLGIGAGLGGCASTPAEADYDLSIRRGDGPWEGAVVVVQPMDRRNFPVNPIEFGPAIDYLKRPEPEATVAGRTDAQGKIRLRLIESFNTKLYLQGAAGAFAVVMLEPVADGRADGARVLHPVVQPERDAPLVQVEVRPAG